MAKLTREEVLKLARLSRLNLTDAEVEQFRTEIGALLQYMDQLQSLNLDGVEPTSQVTGLKNVTRADEVKDYGASPQELLKNAPVIEKGHIKVRRVLE